MTTRHCDVREDHVLIRSTPDADLGTVEIVLFATVVAADDVKDCRGRHGVRKWYHGPSGLARGAASPSGRVLRYDCRVATTYQRPRHHHHYVRIPVGNDPRYARLDVVATSGAERLLLYDRAPWLGGKPTGEALNEVPAGRLAPVEPSKIIGIGSNYRAHCAEMNKPVPKEPLLFMKPPSSLTGPDTAIVRPPGYERTDFEGELGVVIGKRAYRVSAADALSYVFGYTIVNDVSVRDLQKRDGQFTRAKGFDTFCPVGPVVVATGSDTSIGPNNLTLRTRHNGEVRQDSNTSDMVFDVPTLVSFISQVMTLEPGDLIATGTPSGVSPIEPGDRIEIEIEHIGILANPVIERAW